MATRFILGALQLFGIAAAFAIAVALLAPIDAIRFLGVVALVFAGGGFLVQLDALRRFDPHTYRLMRFRCRTVLRRTRSLAVHGAVAVAAAIHHAFSPRSAR